MSAITWIKPRKGQVVVIERRMSHLKLRQSKLLETVENEDEDPARYGEVVASAVDDVKVGDTVLYTKYEGMTGPTLVPDKRPVILRDDQVVCVVDLREFQRLYDEEQEKERAASDSLAAVRSSLIVQG